MKDFFKLGQGPRPDLLEKDLQDKLRKEEKASHEPKTEKDKNLKPDTKDGLAMILALFQLLLPWILGGIALYFLVVFLLTRFGA